MKPTILVIGRNGQLARSIDRASFRDVALAFHGRESCDLTRPDGIRSLIGTMRPAAIINTAAYTAVDKAESDRAAAFALNRDAPAMLARLCTERDIGLVHVSTDYVFDGHKHSPYVESDAKGPLNIYGQSKSEGEDLVLAAGGWAAVIRTSWLYSSQSGNFVTTMLRLAEDREDVGVVGDQLGRPTWAVEAAHACVRAACALIERREEAKGIFHYAGAGEASWADLADAVFEEARNRGKPSARVRRITSGQFPTAARRPQDTRLCTDKFEATFGLAARPWRQALRLCFDDNAG